MYSLCNRNSDMYLEFLISILYIELDFFVEIFDVYIFFFVINDFNVKCI